jgi:endoglucanase
VHEDPAGQSDILARLWRQIAARYADRPAALAFELLNEPRAPMTTGAWNELAASTLAAVREVDTGRRVLIGPAAANTLGALDELELPDDDRLALTFHYYSPFPFPPGRLVGARLGRVARHPLGLRCRPRRGDRGPDARGGMG